jgi:mono/diheme cytochrome c family protein
MRGVFLGLTMLLSGPAVAQDATQGQDLYLSRCAACHGGDAAGDGPMAAVISIPVPDLTQLELRNGGMFPRVAVVQSIDGRVMLRGHGGPMPVFGPVLGGGAAVLDGPDGSVIETVGDVVSIALYLETLQAE